MGKNFLKLFIRTALLLTIFYQTFAFSAESLLGNRLVITNKTDKITINNKELSVYKLRVNNHERFPAYSQGTGPISEEAPLAIYRETEAGRIVPLPLPKETVREIAVYLSSSEPHDLIVENIQKWFWQETTFNPNQATEQQWLMPGTYLNIPEDNIDTSEAIYNNIILYLGQGLALFRTRAFYSDTGEPMDNIGAYIAKYKDLLNSFDTEGKELKARIVHEPDLMDDYVLEGSNVPKLIYGTAWKKEETQNHLFTAIRKGFKGFDSANMVHYNETSAGLGFQQIKNLYICYFDPRDVEHPKCSFNTDHNLFVQTKFTPHQHFPSAYDPSVSIPEQVSQSMTSSLNKLDEDHVDSLILHSPYHGDEKSTMEAWRAMETQVREGKTRFIGVSNTSLQELESLYQQADIKPSFVQNRFWYNHYDEDVRLFCLEHGILYQSFSILTQPDWDKSPPEKVKEIAKKYQLTVAQVIFQTVLRMGVIVLTGTTSTRHMEDDLQSQRNLLSFDDFMTVRNLYLNQ